MSPFKMLIGAASALVLACGLAPQALAGEVSGTGTVTYAATPLSSTKLADGKTVGRVHLKGVVLADDPSVPIHLSSQDCFGATLVSAEGQPIEASGSCDGVDSDGDVWWIWWINTPEVREWHFIGGTGKFAGVSGGGTTVQLTATPDGRTSISWDGSWTMK